MSHSPGLSFCRAGLVAAGVIFGSVPSAGSQGLTAQRSSEEPQDVTWGHLDADELLSKLKDLTNAQESELRIIGRAIERVPQILRGSDLWLQHQFDEDADPLSDPANAEKILADLTLRARLVALSGPNVSLDPAAEPTSQELQALAAAPAAPPIVASSDLAEAAAAAIEDMTQIIREICSEGTAVQYYAGLGSCIPGDEYDPSTFDAVVRITYKGKLICSGVLIDPETIMTAAHCLVSLQSGWLDTGELGFSMRFGDTIYPVANSIPLEPFKKEYLYDYDVALLSIERGIVPENLRFAQFDPIATPDTLGITFVGYGASNADPSGKQPGLRVGKQTVNLAPTVGRSRIEWIFVAGSDAESSSTCFRDSGGPVFAGHPRQVGDALRLIGTISNISTLEGTVPAGEATECTSAKVGVVNLGAADLRQHICSAIDHASGICS